MGKIRSPNGIRDTSDAFNNCNAAPPIRSPLRVKGSEVPPWLAESVGLGDCGWSGSFAGHFLEGISSANAGESDHNEGNCVDKFEDNRQVRVDPVTDVGHRKSSE